MFSKEVPTEIHLWPGVFVHITRPSDPLQFDVYALVSRVTISSQEKLASLSLREIGRKNHTSFHSDRTSSLIQYTLSDFSSENGVFTVNRTLSRPILSHLHQEHLSVLSFYKLPESLRPQAQILFRELLPSNLLPAHKNPSTFPLYFGG